MVRLATLIALSDLSEPARQAAARAAMLARDANASMEALYVLESTLLDELRRMLGRTQESVARRMVDDARESLASFAAAAGQPFGVAAGAHLATGSLLDEIGSRADALDADLLVLGARGAGVVRHLVLGSTAERLLRKSTRSLLVVRRSPREPYRRVLIPVDFSAWSVASMHWAAAVAPGAEITLFHAFEVPFEGKMRFAGVDEASILRYLDEMRAESAHRLRELATQAGFKSGECLSLAAHGDATTRTLELAKERSVDLIAVGKHGRGITEEFLLGSTTKHLLSLADCDVLVTHKR